MLVFSGIADEEMLERHGKLLEVTRAESQDFQQACLAPGLMLLTCGEGGGGVWLPHTLCLQFHMQIFISNPSLERDEV